MKTRITVERGRHGGYIVSSWAAKMSYIDYSKTEALRKFRRQYHKGEHAEIYELR